jgi:hypothetical protein
MEALLYFTLWVEWLIWRTARINRHIIRRPPGHLEIANDLSKEEDIAPTTSIPSACANAPTLLKLAPPSRWPPSQFRVARIPALRCLRLRWPSNDGGMLPPIIRLRPRRTSS